MVFTRKPEPKVLQNRTPQPDAGAAVSLSGPEWA